MSNKVETYKRAEIPVPKTMLRWNLYGAGLENLGQEGRPEEVPVPAYGPDELLVRQDACGLCFSDTKVIAQGPKHPRLSGRDLKRDPVTLGHEVSCTVVGVGANLRGRFEVGQRFIVQADVFYQGHSMAYGYAIPGGLAEYSVIPKSMIEGDEGCYLLPIKDETGYVEAALVEPWACVVASYAQAHRKGIRNGGKMLIIGGQGHAMRNYDWSDLITEEHRPSTITFSSSFIGVSRDSLLTIAETYAIALEWSQFDWAMMKKMSMQAGFHQEQVAQYDDILILGLATPEEIEGASLALADHGILNLVLPERLPRKISLDIGRIHYNGHRYLGTNTERPADAYLETRTAELKPGGNCWILGAGGPMGQMHVQRAVQHPDPPSLILATDVDMERLHSVADRFTRQAQRRHIELVTLNPNGMTPEDFNKRLLGLTKGWGFHDIICMVPFAPIIEQAEDHLADEGWFNIFAGVPRGILAYLDLNKVVHERCRYLGSSGSSLGDMQETLSRVEQGELFTNASLAAIGGMNAAAEGLHAVKDGRFPGKTLIFPQLHNLALTALPQLKVLYPNVYAKLQDGQFWTAEAEEELLRVLLPNDSMKLTREMVP